MCQAPAVTWNTPKTRACITDPDTIEQEVNRIVLDLWGRLPEVVRTVIAHRLKGVKLMRFDPDEPAAYFVQGTYAFWHIVLILEGKEAFGDWRAQVGGAVAWGFAMAFLQSLAVQVPKERSHRQSVTGECRDGLRYERSAGGPWLMRLIESQGESEDRLLSNMAHALAWGLAEEAVAFMPLEYIRKPSKRGDMGGLGWLVGKAHKVLQRRLMEATR
jgi:hypothetical protein